MGNAICKFYYYGNADKYSLPAGGALAVDRDLFAQGVTKQLKEHPNISIQYAEIEEIPESGNWIIATGPLTSSKLAASIATSSGQDSLAFFDAIAPIIYFDTVNMEKADVLNCKYDKSSKGLFVWAKLPEEIKDSEKFIDNLLNEKKIFVAPGTIFGSEGQGYIRFSLCIDESIAVLCGFKTMHSEAYENLEGCTMD